MLAPLYSSRAALTKKSAASSCITYCSGLPTKPGLFRLIAKIEAWIKD
jgi:hypothetical protein